MNGRVYLVGGGPGAIDLYTVKALECIKSARNSNRAAKYLWNTRKYYR